MKKSTVIILWGLITSIASALYFEFLVDSGNSSTGLMLFSFLIFLVGYLIGMKQFRDRVNGGYATFGELYKIGLLMSLVMGVIGVIHGFFIISLHPGYLEDMIDMQRAKLIVYGVPTSSLEQSLRITKWENYNPVGIVVTRFFGSVIIALLLGLIPAGLLTRPKPFMEEDNNTLPS